MKLSQVPEFRAQAMAQEDIKEENSLKEDIKELRKELKDIKLLLTSILMQKGSK